MKDIVRETERLMGDIYCAEDVEELASQIKQMVIEAEIKGLKYITIYNCNDAVTLGLLRKRIAALTQKLEELGNERIK